MQNNTVIGRLTKDVKLEFVGQNSTARVRADLAIEREGGKSVDYLQFVFLGKLAENLNNYSKLKGSLIAVQFTIQNNNYVDKETGNKVYKDQYVVTKVKFLASPNNTAKQGNNTQQEVDYSRESQFDPFGGYEQI
ncbi:single-stranded DNA-binding protein [Periweissella cryptocerci]|uniref:Single-stranded DNA-binding protein n=1 Tax=Periweissella cryptocerci TaxID=2506420 RepID=A0A4P6YQY5_9LACO|nr:single-stranded DNA-binding protein [Periweissella cryptocerci]QBO35003.1 single-stranded DNA-binding protein [Periweissella cryptocerci]